MLLIAPLANPAWHRQYHQCAMLAEGAILLAELCSGESVEADGEIEPILLLLCVTFGDRTLRPLLLENPALPA